MFVKGARDTRGQNLEDSGREGQNKLKNPDADLD
jgi:hypothetical protein